MWQARHCLTQLPTSLHLINRKKYCVCHWNLIDGGHTSLLTSSRRSVVCLMASLDTTPDLYRAILSQVCIGVTLLLARDALRKCEPHLQSGVTSCHSPHVGNAPVYTDRSWVSSIQGTCWGRTKMIIKIYWVDIHNFFCWCPIIIHAKDYLSPLRGSLKFEMFTNLSDWMAHISLSMLMMLMYYLA